MLSSSASIAGSDLRCVKSASGRLRDGRHAVHTAGSRCEQQEHLFAARKQLGAAAGRRCLVAAAHLAGVALCHVGKKGQVVGTHKHLKEARAGCCQLLNVVPAGRHKASKLPAGSQLDLSTFGPP